jgi:hypothetical protein
MQVLQTSPIVGESMGEGKEGKRGRTTFHGNKEMERKKQKMVYMKMKFHR